LIQARLLEPLATLTGVLSKQPVYQGQYWPSQGVAEQSVHISEGTKVGSDTNAQHVMVIIRMPTDV